jgi:uncharacterized protein YbjQ (UPF0145 family)
MPPSVLMLTTGSAEGYEVEAYLGPISAQVVIGTGALTDVLSSFTDFFGAPSRSYESKLDRINDSVIRLLDEKARRMRANVVLGLRIDHDEVSGGGKSMLMVTAAGTAARMRRLKPGAETLPDAPETVSATRLKAELRRQRILGEANRGELDIADGGAWKFIRETSMPELGSAVCEAVRAPGISGEQARQKLEEYLLSIPRDDAVRIIFAELRIAPDNAFEDIAAVAAAQHLMDFELAYQALRELDQKARFRAARLLLFDTDVYGPSDVKWMQACIAELEAAFPDAELEKEDARLLRSERMVWRCECGNAVPADRSQCTCGRDRKGFRHDSVRPERLAAHLSRKVEVLDDLLGLEPRSGSEVARST